MSSININDSLSMLSEFGRLPNSKDLRKKGMYYKITGNKKRKSKDRTLSKMRDVLRQRFWDNKLFITQHDCKRQDIVDSLTVIKDKYPEISIYRVPDSNCICAIRGWVDKGSSKYVEHFRKALGTAIECYGYDYNGVTPLFVENLKESQKDLDFLTPWMIKLAMKYRAPKQEKKEAEPEKVEKDPKKEKEDSVIARMVVIPRNEDKDI